MTDKLLKKAINKHKAGQFAAAQSLYRKLLKANPNHVDANYMLGTLYAEQGDGEKAVHYLKVSETLAPESPFIKNNLGNAYRVMGELESAAQSYEKALAIQPDMVEALNNLAIVQRRLSQNDNAIALYKAAISHSPNFSEAHYNLGKSYWDDQQFDNAMACFQRVLDIKPQHALAFHELGNCYMKQGNRDKAIECFEQYLALVDVDECGAGLKLSYLKGGELPERQPESLIVQTYEKKARTWDTDVTRSDMAFLGPQHMAEAVNKYVNENNPLLTLDLGCGTGLCAESLKSVSSVLHGVDVSSQMLNIARGKQLYDELFCDDIVHYMSSTDKQYDLILASGVLIFFGDLQPVLMAAHQILNKHGLLIFTLYRSNGEPVEIRDNMHFAHSESYIKDLAAALSFEPVTVDEVVHEYENNIPQPGFVVCLKRNAL